MKTLKSISFAMLTIALAISVTFSCFNSARQDTSGSYSAASTVTEKSAQWILEQFGHCQTIPGLLLEIDRFGCKNFVYDASGLSVLQHFDLEKFLFENNFHGVCYDFSCFVKSVVLVWSDANQQQGVEAYVYSVFLPDGAAHAYNFVIADGRTYYLCLTTNVGAVSSGKKSYGFYDITGWTPKEFITACHSTVFNIQ